MSWTFSNPISAVESDTPHESALHRTPIRAQPRNHDMELGPF